MQNEEGRHLALKLNTCNEVTDKIKKAIEQIPKNPTKFKLETRYNSPYMPIVKVQDYEYPSNNVKSFDNYLVAVENNQGI